MIRTSLLTALMLTGLLALPIQAASIYKWIDEQGITHYSSKPPILDGNAEVIKVPGEPDEIMDPEEAIINGHPESLDKNSPNPEVVQYCQKLFENLKALATDDDVRLEHEDGSFEILGDEGKEREKENVREQLKKYCQVSQQKH